MAKKKKSKEIRIEYADLEKIIDECGGADGFNEEMASVVLHTKCKGDVEWVIAATVEYEPEPEPELATIEINLGEER